MSPAFSWLAASMGLKPPKYSLVSVNGSSTALARPPLTRTSDADIRASSGSESANDRLRVPRARTDQTALHKLLADSSRPR